VGISNWSVSADAREIRDGDAGEVMRHLRGQRRIDLAVTGSSTGYMTA
jgi:hypothetical protein